MNELAQIEALPANAATDQAVWCVECGRWTYPDHRWRCYHEDCNRLAYWGYGYGRCEKCGFRAFGRRTGYQWQVMCDCDRTPEEIDRSRRAMLARDNRDKAEDAKATAGAVNRARATECWEQKRCICSVVMTDPAYKFCWKCPRWDKCDAPRRNAALPLPVESEWDEVELDIPCG